MSDDSKAAYHALRQPADAWVHTSPDELRNYQKEHGVSPSRLARHLHANTTSLKQWLDGTKIPSLVMQQRFKEALGTKPQAAEPKASPARTAKAPKPLAASTSAARPKSAASTSAARPKSVAASTSAARPRPATSTSAARPKAVAASTSAARPKPVASTSAARPKPVASTSATRRGGRKPGKWVHLAQDAVAKFRKDAKLSRAKLAELLGVSSTSISNWETGQSIPVTRYQQRLVELMNGKPVSDAPSAGGVAASVGSRRAEPVASSGSPALEATRLTVVGEILKGYLATPQGGKVSQEQLVALARALHGAL